MSDLDPLQQPLELPCGVSLPNRIAKAPMTEGLADPEDRATAQHQRLYQRWSEGGAGLLLTGNVMLDRRYLERAGNVVIDGNGGEDRLASWARAGTRAGNHLWMQISHPGRQCSRFCTSEPVAPSAVPMVGLLNLFAPPRAMRVDEIEAAIAAWGRVAETAKGCGFTGVQIHAAHGYLISQFLSPRVNRRDDAWGGSLENRARLLLRTVVEVRGAVGSDFPVAVKLNSADFQKGGFSNEDAAQVAIWLAERDVDLVEISGGTYEQTAVFGNLGGDADKAASTKRREAYFLQYAQNIREAVPDLKLMVTGGFRTASFMRGAVERGEVDVIGIARPFCLRPDLPRAIFDGGLEQLPMPERDLQLGPGPLGRASPSRNLRSLNAQAEVAWFYRQIIHLSEGREPDLELGAWTAMNQHMLNELRLSRRRTYRG